MGIYTPPSVTPPFIRLRQPVQGVGVSEILPLVVAACLIRGCCDNRVNRKWCNRTNRVSATVSYEQSTLAKFIEKAPVLLGGLVGLIALLALAVRIRKKPPLAR